eukprot:jgi/Mesvir1/23755/Mv18686-RA.3
MRPHLPLYFPEPCFLPSLSTVLRSCYFLRPFTRKRSRWSWVTLASEGGCAPAALVWPRRGLACHGADSALHAPNTPVPGRMAPWQGSDEAVRVLLAHRPSLTARSKRGLTPLGEALVSQRVRAARMLVDAGADASVDVRGYSLLHVCAGMGAHVSLIFLLGEGRLPPTSANNPGRLTPLHCVLLGGVFACLPPLLEAKGVDADIINAEDTEGRTPLDYVLEEGECAEHADAREMAQVLRAQGGRSGSGVASGSFAAQATQHEGRQGGGNKWGVQASGSATSGGRGVTVGGKSADAAATSGRSGSVNKEDPDEATLRRWCRLSPQQLGELRLSDAVKKRVAQMETQESYNLMRRNAEGLAGDERFVEMLQAPVVREALRRMKQDRENVRAFQGHPGVMAVVARMGEALQRVRAEGLPVELGLFIDMLYEEAGRASAGTSTAAGSVHGSQGGGGTSSGARGGAANTPKGDDAAAEAGDSPHGSTVSSQEEVEDGVNAAEPAKDDHGGYQDGYPDIIRRPRHGWKKELGYAVLRSLVPVVLALIATMLWYPFMQTRFPLAKQLPSQAADRLPAAAGSGSILGGLGAGSEGLDLGDEVVHDSCITDDSSDPVFDSEL